MCPGPTVITCFKFGDDRFRGLASLEGQILPFPIDVDGRPYNTLKLPGERVIHPSDRRTDRWTGDNIQRTKHIWYMLSRTITVTLTHADELNKTQKEQTTQNVAKQNYPGLVAIDDICP